MGWSELDNDIVLNQKTAISSFCERINFGGSISIIEERDLGLQAEDDVEILSFTKADTLMSKIIITIPAYNEENAIGNTINSIKKEMNKTKYHKNYIILVVNDGSSDNTVEEASQAGAYVFTNKRNLGLSFTFQTEIKICLELGADIIVHTDADEQYPANKIPRLIEQVELGYDLVLGSRFKGTIESMSWMKRFGNLAFSIVISALSNQIISDSQTGFRAFTNKVAKEIPIISDHTYTQEQIIRAARNRYNIKEIPIYFTKRRNGTSRLIRSPFEYAVRAWKNILKIYLSKSKK